MISRDNSSHIVAFIIVFILTIAIISLTLLRITFRQSSYARPPQPYLTRVSHGHVTLRYVTGARRFRVNCCQ